MRQSLCLLVQPFQGLYGITIYPFLDGTLWIRLVIQQGISSSGCVELLAWTGKVRGQVPAAVSISIPVRLSRDFFSAKTPVLKCDTFFFWGAKIKIKNKLRKSDLIWCVRITHWVCVSSYVSSACCCLREMLRARREKKRLTADSLPEAVRK